MFVADRENSRIQIFSSNGDFLQSWDWVNRPDDLFIDQQENLYIAELGWTVPVPDRPHFPWSKHAPIGHAPIARVTICDLDGDIQTQIGGNKPLLPGNFIVPHGIWATRAAISTSARWSRRRARSSTSRRSPATPSRNSCTG